MHDKKEIELKLYIGDATDLLSRLAELGWKQTREEEQQDIYYTSQYKDFIKTEECLRIRSTPTEEQLTWKPPTSDGMRERGQYWKQEVDIDITGQSNKVRLMLEKLGFIEFVTVKKHRLIFQVDEDSIVVLDHIEPLGWFVEIETFGDKPDYGTQKNIQIARLLKVEMFPQINVPYRDMVKAGRVYSALTSLKGASEEAKAVIDS